MNNPRPRLILRLLLPPALAFTAVTMALAQEGTANLPPGAPAAVEKSLLDLFNAGGALMWPILLC